MNTKHDQFYIDKREYVLVNINKTINIGMLKSHSPITKQNYFIIL